MVARGLDRAIAAGTAAHSGHARHPGGGPL
jgi:CO dehydrogenase/acetyl-CoA synthase alpha subunit